jgi:hypothetical protein
MTFRLLDRESRFTFSVIPAQAGEVPFSVNPVLSNIVTVRNLKVIIRNHA